MSHIKSLFEEVSAYLAAGQTSAAFELINCCGLSNPREQIAAVRKLMKPTDKPNGSNRFRHRKRLIRRAQKKAHERYVLLIFFYNFTWNMPLTRGY